MHGLGHQQRPEIADQIRPGKRIDERGVGFVPLPEHQQIAESGSQGQDPDRVAIEDYPGIRHGGREEPVGIDRRQPEKKIHAHYPEEKTFFLGLPELLQLPVRHAVFRSHQMVLVHEREQSGDLHLICVEPGIVDLGQKIIQRIVAVEHPQNCSRADGQLVIMFGKRIEEQGIIALFTGRKEPDIRPDSAGPGLFLLRRAGRGFYCISLFGPDHITARGTTERDCGRGNSRV